MELQKLDELYKLYKFQRIDINNERFRVYSYTSKYFSNADVIKISNNISNDDVQLVSDQISQLGFSVNIRDYKTLKEAEESLFDGFFDIKISNDQLYQSYVEYKRKIEKIIFGNYEYITSEYQNLESGQVYGDSIVDKILSDFETPGPVLIMLEAAAGFGKTSTSYEVLKYLSQKKEKSKVTLFTELSRNRQASIFKYVLYDEINNRFTGLNLELVTKQIIEGRIPVIIDGFDELLKTKSLEKKEDKFEDAEPMLETIKELLQGQAKILITTRRTAIFSDDEFFRWLDNNESAFTFRHYGISPPTITDWISAAKEKQLKNAGLNIKSISNPVLLAYLKNMNEQRFEECVNNIDLIIGDYISKLMEREQERQDLLMNENEQRRILKIISKHFTDQDVTSDSKEIIESKIMEKEDRLLYEVLERYPAGKRPTLDQLLSKLMIHAFLDKKSEDGQQIGFVNDFILGNFVGENLLDDKDSWFGFERFVDFILTAYLPRSIMSKKEIYNLLNQQIIQYLALPKRIFIDNYLNGCISRDIEGEYIEGLEFRSNFNCYHNLKDVFFTDCEFHNILFDFSNVLNCYFINCQFYNCLFPSMLIDSNKIVFTNCHANPEVDFDQLLNDAGNETMFDDDLNNYEKEVLEKFWPMGKERFIPFKRHGTLRLGVPKEEIEEIDVAIANLIKKGILIERRGHHSLELNISLINEIKIILGR